MRFFKYISILVIAGLSAYFLFLRNTPYQEISGKIFGTYYNVKIKTEQKNRTLSIKIKNELDRINSEMSVFEPESETNKINDTAFNEQITLSNNMSNLLKNAQKIYQLTNGNFDPTVGPLVELWGFGTQKNIEPPTEEQINETLKNVGFNNLIFSNNYTKLQKKNNNIKLNLSAIAKGYAVDQLAQLLKNEGYKNFVIEIGGEVYASGQKSGTNKGWNIGIAYPSKDSQTTSNAAVVRLSDMAAATSGDYRNYYYQNNKRYSHTISPTTGFPVDHNLASVTVFDSSCMQADAIATGIMALGEVEGLKLANKHNIPIIMFIRNDNNEFIMQTSKSADKLLNKYGTILYDKGVKSE